MPVSHPDCSKPRLAPNHKYHACLSLVAMCRRTEAIKSHKLSRDLSACLFFCEINCWIKRLIKCHNIKCQGLEGLKGKTLLVTSWDYVSIYLPLVIYCKIIFTWLTEENAHMQIISNQINKKYKPSRGIFSICTQRTLF